MSANALEIVDLTIREWGGAPLVENVNLVVPRGRPLVVIGETGSGKSLVAQAVLGLLPEGMAASGTVRVGDGPPIPAGNAAALRLFWACEVALVPQEPANALDPTMRIGRQLASAGSGRGPVDPVTALANVDLSTDVARAYPFALSGGMAQRVVVATALAGGAPLVIADEPTKGLDRERVGQTVELLRRLSSEGRSLLVITHDPAVARAMDGTLAVMREGRIVENAPATQVFEAPRHPYTRAWLAADPATWKACPRCCAMNDLVLAAHGLSFGYARSRPLFRDLDLHVPRGGVLALVGPSGSGKSTLGNVLLGRQRPFAGEVSWAGADPYRDPAALRRLRRRYQKLHQDPATAFLPNRPIGRQLADIAEVFTGLDLVAALPPLLERLKLRDALLQRYSGEVSGGEAQRLALARVLLLDPALIVADEPTSRLDPIVQKETIELLRELIDERGLGLVLISHDRMIVRATADEIVDLS